MEPDPCAYCGAVGQPCVIIVIPGDPKSKERPRVGKGNRVYTPKTTADEETRIRAQWPRSVPPFDVPVRLDLVFCAETGHRSDIDNKAKLVMDALNRSKAHPGGVAYTDDWLVHDLRARIYRKVGKGNGKTWLHITPVPPEPATHLVGQAAA